MFLDPLNAVHIHLLGFLGDHSVLQIVPIETHAEAVATHTGEASDLMRKQIIYKSKNNKEFKLHVRKIKCMSLQNKVNDLVLLVPECTMTHYKKKKGQSQFRDSQCNASWLGHTVQVCRT